MSDIRTLALWLTGRDILEPAVPTVQFGNWKLFIPPEPRWEFRLASEADRVFLQSVGPNVLHRVAQRAILGVVWRMLPPVTEPKVVQDESVKADSEPEHVE